LTVLTVLSIFFLSIPQARAYNHYVLSSRELYHSKRLASGGYAHINFDDSICPLTFTTFYRDSQQRRHFNTVWIRTDTDLSISSWFTNDNLTYSTSGGTQEIFYPYKPNAVYFNGNSKTEGDGWTYNNQIVIVTPSGTDVTVLWGSPPSGEGGSSSAEDGDGGLETVGPPSKFASTLIIISLTVICLTLLWLGETTKKRRR